MACVAVAETCAQIGGRSDLDSVVRSEVAEEYQTVILRDMHELLAVGPTLHSVL